ncbi:MAG: hypothetical protein ACI8X5_002690 [Planctomycetota bacterium]
MKKLQRNGLALVCIGNFFLCGVVWRSMYEVPDVDPLIYGEGAVHRSLGALDAAGASLSNGEPSLELERLVFVNQSLRPVPVMEEVTSGGISGRLLGFGDQPLMGVSLTTLGFGREGSEATTDGEGRFVFSEPKRGRFRFAIDPVTLPEGYLGFAGPLKWMSETFSLVNDEAFEIDLRVPLGSSVYGAVVGVDGEPAQRVSVSLLSVDKRTISGLTDSQGFFRIKGLAPGPYVAQAQVQVGSPSDRGASHAPLQFEIAEGESQSLPNIVLQLDGREIFGRAVDQSGAGAPHILVTAWCADDDGVRLTWMTETDPEGFYSLASLPAAILELKFSSHSEFISTIGCSESIDLTKEKSPYDAGEWEIFTMGKFIVEGSVQVDAVWAKSKGVQRYTLQLVEPKVSDEGPYWIDPGQAEFYWSYDAWSEPVVLRVLLETDRGDSYTSEVLLDPIGGRKKGVVIQFP